MSKIPVIDFSRVREDDPRGMEEVAEKVKEACHGIGFMYLTNHGIPKETIQAALKESVNFFNLPEKRKTEFLLSAKDLYKGYSKPGMELLKPDSSFEFRESFAIIGVECAQRFPEELPEFKNSLYALAQECNVLTRRLLKVFGIALDLPDKDLFLNSNRGLTDMSVPNRVTIRTHFYPSIPRDVEIPKNSTRCGEHTDYGVCTLLFQDDVGGLEARNADGSWVPATPIQDTILVNLGDVMEMWTGSYFKATGHRVQIPEAEIRDRCARQSIAYFVVADDDLMITPLTSTQNYDFGPEFQPMRYAEFLDKRIGATYQ